MRVGVILRAFVAVGVSVAAAMAFLHGISAGVWRAGTGRRLHHAGTTVALQPTSKLHM